MAYTQRYYVLLTSRGNPDMGQDPRWRVPGTERPALAYVDDFAEASAVALDYIARNGLGGGNWHGAPIFDAATNQQLAYVSYNGKVWPGRADDWQPGTEPLYSPRA